MTHRVVVMSPQSSMAPMRSVAPVHAAAPIPRVMSRTSASPTISYVVRHPATATARPLIPSISPPPNHRTAPVVQLQLEECKPGAEVVINGLRFRCQAPLGRGSFGYVWAGTLITLGCMEAALKDIRCANQGDLQQALIEVSLLERFQSLTATAQGQASPVMRIPRYFAHRVDRKDGCWNVRVAMSRVPGESLDAFLRRPPQPGQDGQKSIRRGCALALALIQQLGPALEFLAPHAWHRDLNSHNVLISDAMDGGRFWDQVPVQDIGKRASFWLIDFGLAVDATTWSKAWPFADVAGDCRYWPPSSWMTSLLGPDETKRHPDLSHQYQFRLDVAGLGMLALELLCQTNLTGQCPLSDHCIRSSWKKLFCAWMLYRDEVTRWHSMVFQVFSTGGDVNALYDKLNQENAVGKVIEHLHRIREYIRCCASRMEDPVFQKLLLVIATMIDETQRDGMTEVLNELGVQRPKCEDTGLIRTASISAQVAEKTAAATASLPSTRPTFAGA